MRHVYASPDYKPAATPGEVAALAEESGCPPEEDPAIAGWDFSMGARINYGRDPGGTLCVDLQIGPDYDGSGVLRRQVTPAQLVAHAHQLLKVARDEIIAGRRLVMAPAECMIDTAISSSLGAAKYLGAIKETQ